jgi:methenyltetrahydrofolate cyclohydrolase
MLQNFTVKEFVEELASNSPAPGGGSAAALSAALGSALGAMVFNLTIGKKIYNEYDDEKKELINSSLYEANKGKDEFLSLMEKDAEEFLVLMDAFKLPKNTEEEKSSRMEKINEGYIKALEIPFNVALKAFKIYKYIEIAAIYGNKNAVSDAGVAALLIQTSIESAVLNVKINLSAIKDDNYKQQVSQKCNNIIKEGLLQKEKIIEIVNSKI